MYMWKNRNIERKVENKRKWKDEGKSWRFEDRERKIASISLTPVMGN